jgi:hypothetical protein
MTGALTHEGAPLPPQNIFAPDQHLQSLAQMPQAPTRITSSRAPATGRAIFSTR